MVTPRKSLTQRQTTSPSTGVRDPRGDSDASHKIALGLLAFFFVLASWLFGGVVLWTRQVLFGAALLPFLLALAPIPNRAERTGARAASARAFRRLVLFPPFWFGLLLFAYVGLQWSNPAWTYTEIGGKWWISNAGLQPNPDWPTSVHAPPERGNPASFLLRFGAVWMVVCAGWILVRRRRDLLVVLVPFAVNSFLVALVAVIQEMRPPDKVLWLYPWEGNDFSGPFFYRNHGGAFFYSAMTVCFGLALFFQRTKDPSTGKGSPGPVFVVFALMNAGAVAASGSRAGWIFGAAGLIVYVVLATGVWLRRSEWRGSWVGGATVGACIAVLAASIVASQNTAYLEHHFRRFLNIPAELDSSGRTIGNEASLAMFGDVPVFGYGADSYGHVFSLYIDEFPQLVRRNRRTGRIRTNWVQAHNDPLQYAVELGLVGALLLALSPLYFVLVFLARLLRFRDESLLWLAGILFLFAHSFAELLFQSVILLALFSFLFLAVERSLRFEGDEPAGRPRRAPPR